MYIAVTTYLIGLLSILHSLQHIVISVTKFPLPQAGFITTNYHGRVFSVDANPLSFRVS